MSNIATKSGVSTNSPVNANEKKQRNFCNLSDFQAGAY